MRQTPLDFHHPADEALQALALHEDLQATIHWQGWCGGKRWQPTHEDLKLRAGWDTHEPGRRCAWGPRYERTVQPLDQRLRPTTETDVWQREGPDMGTAVGSKAGIILPQAITMAQ